MIQVWRHGCCATVVASNKSYQYRYVGKDTSSWRLYDENDILYFRLLRSQTRSTPISNQN